MNKDLIVLILAIVAGVFVNIAYSFAIDWCFVTGWIVFAVALIIDKWSK